MNKIMHADILDFVNSVEYVAHNFTSEELEEVDSTSLILQCIETVDNCVDALTLIEFVVTRNGYELRYEVAEGIEYTDDQVHADLARALEMAQEDLWNNDDAADDLTTWN